MTLNETTPITLRFDNAGRTETVSVEALTASAIEFLDTYQNSRFASQAFWKSVGSGDGEKLFSNLLQITGFEADPKGFFSKIMGDVAAGKSANGIEINNLPLPTPFLVSLLERVFPKSGYASIKTTKQLEELTNIHLPDDQKDSFQKVIDTYPVRLSHHTVRQLMVSDDVGYQYLPFIEELDKVGFTNTWIGQFHDGLLEQMYKNRVIFLLNMSCPVYCRFCFRKHKDSRNEKNPTVADVNKAVDHVRVSPSVKEIVVTGGDPFLNRANMAATLDGLMEVPHVQTLRLATRSIAYYPALFLEKEGTYLKYLKEKSFALQQRGKRMEVATHFIHPDEVSPESVEIITDLVNSGVAVYIQTPFLSGCNDTGTELVQLFSHLRSAGAEMHYIYIPCSPIHGNSVYWNSLGKGIDIASHLRAHLSDRAIPRICTATPIGKLDWFSSGWAVERVAGNENFVWLRTPYTPDYFKSFAPLSEKFDNMRVNDEGTIDIQYMAQIGNDDYLIGPRPAKADAAEKNERHANSNAEAGIKISLTDKKTSLTDEKTSLTDKKTSLTDEKTSLTDEKSSLTDEKISSTDEKISEIHHHLISVRQTARSIVNAHFNADTDVGTLWRTHETRVELSPEAGKSEIDYIRNDERITDVVISSKKDAVDSLFAIGKIIGKLREIPHVNAVRLKSMKFNTAPEAYTRGVINALGALNHLTVADPLRLEIETWFIQKDDLSDIHEKLTRRLNNRGITVYCNVPLLKGINDSDTAIHDLAYTLRQCGIEFHHLYVAGLPIQEKWNRDHPIESYDVIDIATMVRREGSGREIPRYIIATDMGEVDYGLTSSFVRENGALKIKLDCYPKSYYTEIDSEFTAPSHVEWVDEKPVLPMTGLIKRDDFPIS